MIKKMIAAVAMCIVLMGSVQGINVKLYPVGIDNKTVLETMSLTIDGVLPTHTAQAVRDKFYQAFQTHFGEDLVNAETVFFDKDQAELIDYSETFASLASRLVVTDSMVFISYCIKGRKMDPTLRKVNEAWSADSTICKGITDLHLRNHIDHIGRVYNAYLKRQSDQSAATAASAAQTAQPSLLTAASTPLPNDEKTAKPKTSASTLGATGIPVASASAVNGAAKSEKKSSAPKTAASKSAVSKKSEKSSAASASATQGSSKRSSSRPRTKADETPSTDKKHGRRSSSRPRRDASPSPRGHHRPVQQPPIEQITLGPSRSGWQPPTAAASSAKPAVKETAAVFAKK